MLSVPILKSTDLTSMAFESQKLIISHSTLQLTMTMPREINFFMQIFDGMWEIHHSHKGYSRL